MCETQTSNMIKKEIKPKSKKKNWRSHHHFYICRTNNAKKMKNPYGQPKTLTQQYKVKMVKNGQIFSKTKTKTHLYFIYLFSF